MKKRTLIVLLLTVCLMLPASAVTISFVIKAAYGARVLAAFDAQSDSEMNVSFGDSPTGYNASIGIDIPPRDPNETDTEFVEGRIELIVRKLVRAHEERARHNALDAAIAVAITDANLPEVTEPNSIEE